MTHATQKRKQTKPNYGEIRITCHTLVCLRLKHECEHEHEHEHQKYINTRNRVATFSLQWPWTLENERGRCVLTGVAEPCVCRFVGKPSHFCVCVLTIPLALRLRLGLRGSLTLDTCIRPRAQCIRRSLAFQYSLRCPGNEAWMPPPVARARLAMPASQELYSRLHHRPAPF